MERESGRREKRERGEREIAEREREGRDIPLNRAYSRMQELRTCIEFDRFEIVQFKLKTFLKISCISLNPYPWF